MMGLAVENLVVRFPSQAGHFAQVLSIPHWAVEPSAQVCVAGASGSGKTTLLHVLAGLLEPSGGRVRVGDVELTALSESARDAFRAAHVGMVFQTARLLPELSALDNVALAASISGRRRARARTLASDLLEQMGIEHRASAHPGTLSVGEQQRVALARALASDPKLLLADEPTASLDPDRTDAVVTLLQAAASERGTTVVLVTHERSVQARFDQVVRLDELQSSGTGEPR